MKLIFNRGFTWGLLLVGIAVAQTITIIVHELGHFFCDLLLGWIVTEVEFGTFGNKIFSFNCADIIFTFHSGVLVPLSGDGYCLSTANFDDPWIEYKKIFSYLAGPLATTPLLYWGCLRSKRGGVIKLVCRFFGISNEKTILTWPKWQDCIIDHFAFILLVFGILSMLNNYTPGSDGYEAYEAMRKILASI